MNAQPILQILYFLVHLPESRVMETVAFDAEDDELVEETFPRTLFAASMKVGLDGWSMGLALLRSKTTTSDMVGLAATVDWVQSRAISIPFLTSSGLYSSGSKDLSTSLIKSPFSYDFHAWLTNGNNRWNFVNCAQGSLKSSLLHCKLPICQLVQNKITEEDKIEKLVKVYSDWH